MKTLWKVKPATLNQMIGYMQTRLAQIEATIATALEGITDPSGDKVYYAGQWRDAVRDHNLLQDLLLKSGNASLLKPSSPFEPGV